jgi:phosphopantothenoylcysteine decarboxylase/phosphopantothenate--cysteine ligase
LLSTLYLATEAPTFIAPAMNQRMWQHSATQRNIETLRSDGVEFIGPNDGLQACGEEGPGRMAEPKEIIHQVLKILGNKKTRKTVNQKNTAQDYLSGKNILITAGPTREPIDPVRYITNSSSGRQGYALAEAAIEAGSKVTLISGPVSIPKPPVSELINVTTAREMKKAVTERVKNYDMVIAVAAVADYRPAESKDLKIKKLPNSENHLSLNLVENDDIVASVSSLPNRPFMVGFAAETHNAVQFAREKRLRKNLDVIVCNDVSDSSIGFESNENAVTVIYENGEKVLEKASKQEIARELIHLFGKLYSKQKISRVG